MVTRILKWGNSLGLRIPKSFALQAGVKEGSSGEIALEGDISGSDDGFPGGFNFPGCILRCGRAKLRMKYHRGKRWVGGGGKAREKCRRGIV